MKAKTSAAYTASKGDGRIGEWRLICSFEGPALFEALREEKQRESEEQDADGNRCAKRPVVDRAEKSLHDVGNHGAVRTANEERCEKIAERQNERESGSRKKT